MKPFSTSTKAITDHFTLKLPDSPGGLPANHTSSWFRACRVISWVVVHRSNQKWSQSYHLESVGMDKREDPHPHPHPSQNTFYSQRLHRWCFCKWVFTRHSTWSSLFFGENSIYTIQRRSLNESPSIYFLLYTTIISPNVTRKRWLFVIIFQKFYVEVFLKYESRWNGLCKWHEVVRAVHQESFLIAAVHQEF